MKHAIVCIASLILFGSGTANAQAIGSDSVLDALSKYLAKQWSFPYTGFVGNGYLRVGHIYGYDEPRDYCDLLRYQRKGKKINVSLFDDSLQIKTASPIQTQRYLVQDKLANFIALTLAAELREAGVSSESFRNALKEVNMRFTVSRVAYPEATLIRALKQTKLTDEISVSTMHGFVVPHELLLISDFNYDSNAAKRVGAGLSINWLTTLNATIAAQKAGTTQTTLGVPDNSVAAFKVIPFPPAAIRCQ